MIKTAEDAIKEIIRKLNPISGENGDIVINDILQIAKSAQFTQQPQGEGENRLEISDEYYNQLSKNLGKTQPYHFTGKKCVTGCKRFHGYETKHHKDCPFYPNSLSEKYDKIEQAHPSPVKDGWRN